MPIMNYEAEVAGERKAKPKVLDEYKPGSVRRKDNNKDRRIGH